jgi:hypothetical protein
MPQVIQITTGRTAKLGKVVEVREMTVEQWLARPEDAPSDGINLLKDMLYIDGDPIGHDRLMKLGMGEMQGALNVLNEILGQEDDSGNA